MKFQEHPVFCIDDKCVFPINKKIHHHNDQKIKEDDIHQQINVKQFDDLGVPMVLLNEQKSYVSPDQDIIIESFETKMMPEVIYTELLKKMEPKNVPKKARQSRRGKRKQKETKKERSKSKSPKSKR